jgi:transcriptional regulator of acetoin/glycerol metabolism
VIDSGALVDARAAASALRDISPSIGAPNVASPVVAEDPLVSLDDAEKRHIEAVLRATGGNQTQAAFILGIERKTLARKIKRFDISI